MQDSGFTDLKIADRGGYARGREGFEQILRAAYGILIDEGSKALTMRRIATACGLQIGHLAHYFRSKQDLIRELLNAIIGGYEDAFAAIAHRAGLSAEDRLAALVGFVLDDIGTERTTRIFPELWAMANHDAFVQERVDDLYRRARVALEDLVAELNPALPPDERALVALFMSASMEGMTIFAGHGKKWRDRLPELKVLTARSFMHTLRALRPGDLAAGTSLNPPSPR